MNLSRPILEKWLINLYCKRNEASLHGSQEEVLEIESQILDALSVMIPMFREYSSQMNKDENGCYVFEFKPSISK